MRDAGGRLRERGSCNRKGTELKTPITLLVKMLYPEGSVPTLAQTWIIFTRLKWAIFSECPTCVCSFALKTPNCKTENTLQRRRAILTHDRNSQLRNRANMLSQHAIQVAVHSLSLWRTTAIKTNNSNSNLHGCTVHIDDIKSFICTTNAYKLT